MINILKVRNEKDNINVDVISNTFEGTNWRENTRRISYTSESAGIVHTISKGRELKKIQDNSIFNSENNSILLYMIKTDTAIVEKHKDEKGKKDNMLFLDIDLTDYVEITHIKNNNPILSTCRAFSTLEDMVNKSYPAIIKVVNSNANIRFNMNVPKEKKLYELAIDIENFGQDNQEVKIEKKLIKGGDSGIKYKSTPTSKFIIRTSKKMKDIINLKKQKTLRSKEAFSK